MRHRTLRSATILGFVVLSTFTATVSAARAAATPVAHCAAHGGRPDLPPLADVIGIVFDHDVVRPLVEEAIARWSRCAGYGTDFPALVVGRTGSITVEVRFVRAHRGSRRCGSFQGRTIFLYAFAVDERGRSHFCGSRADGLVHELGHVLGLLDAPHGAACRHHAMAAIDAGHRDRREIQEAECRAAGAHWLTSGELAGSRTSRLAAVTRGRSVGLGPGPGDGRD